MISAFNMRIFEVPGYEADDILQCQKGGIEGGCLYRHRQGYAQLVDNRVKVYDPMKDRVFDEEFVGRDSESARKLQSSWHSPAMRLTYPALRGRRKDRELLVQFGASKRY
jgi:hypothetical protein